MVLGLFQVIRPYPSSLSLSDLKPPDIGQLPIGNVLLHLSFSSRVPEYRTTENGNLNGTKAYGYVVEAKSDF